MKKVLEGAGKIMRGRTAEKRARTREIMGLAEEATTFFAFACHKGSALFALMEKQDPRAANFAMAACKRTLGLTEEY